ncbi:uncharacterized protein LOC125205253 [Salvia hispanica]|uniref:uncharacterized protein LOC125205253 n=1 Tax=Salvia hispanica TaxID=49212 RepID=UPI002008F7AA|nr:uncharacterized protein LOC125205253 [Salvia hispanica]
MAEDEALTRALFDAVNEAKAECLAQMQREQAAAEARVPRPIRRRTFVPREHDVAHELSGRRDRQTRPRRCRSARLRFRQLAYGTTTDMFDEYLHVGETTGRECLKTFCKLVVEAFGDTYLRRPTADDCQSLMRMHETVHGFPGMLGSIDSGSNNDINVLNSSTIFADQCRGRGLAIQFTANDRTHHMGYYLADHIYPRWPVFLKTISCPIGERRVLFAAKQGVARKDVERAFGVLQSRWAIVKGPTRFWYKEVIADVMYACIIMHNMIVEQERGHVTDWVDDDDYRLVSVRFYAAATGLNAQPTRPYSAHDRHD